MGYGFSKKFVQINMKHTFLRNDSTLTMGSTCDKIWYLEFKDALEHRFLTPCFQYFGKILRSLRSSVILFHF